jgi:hypothetical protein
MISNKQMGICKKCAFKDVHCIEREESDKNNLLVTYACNDFRGIKTPLRCDIDKCGAIATKYVDDHGVDTVLCEDHYTQFLKFEKSLSDLK